MRCNYFQFLLCLLFLSSDDNSGSSSSSIVFQSLSVAPADADQSAKVPQSATQAPQAVAPPQETGQVVCPKTMRCIPRNYVPCVFLGQQELIKKSKCPATAWDRAAQLDELSSRSSNEMNNNSCCNTDIQQWSEVAFTKPSQEVCRSIHEKQGLPNSLIQPRINPLGSALPAGSPPPDALHSDAAV